MSVKLQPLTFDGGVNLKADPHALNPNEWLKLQNMWPFKDKFIGSRPSLLHDQDILPVPGEFWNADLFYNTADYPTAIPYYGQWFRHLTPLKAIFLGSLDQIALICVCNLGDNVVINEQFEGEDAEQVTLNAGDVILMVMPNDMRSGAIYPVITAVRLGAISNITPSLINFNGDVIAANKDCNYVVRVVNKDTLLDPSATVWPDIPYRFTKINFGETNLDFRADGVIVYKNRFVYWKGNRLWFSDAFQPQTIYPYAVNAAYLGVFFNTGLTEDITALGVVYLSDAEQIAATKLAIWTQNGMLTLAGEPANTIASTPEEIWTPCVVSDINIPSGCISAASIVKTKYGLIWCGAKSVWFMQGDATPVEVGYKIGPRIEAQSFSSAGRIFATFDEDCYRLVINSPGVGYNPYAALNEMWCLSFLGDVPNKNNAAWFGPQVFTNMDNPNLIDNGDPDPYGPGGVVAAGLYCCAKLTNINDDRTYYIQPYSADLGVTDVTADNWGTRLGLATIKEYLGVDITAPFRPVAVIQPDYNYQIGAIIQGSLGAAGEVEAYVKEFYVTTAGEQGGTIVFTPVYCNSSVSAQWSKRPLYTWMEDAMLTPLFVPYKVSIQAGNLTFDNPELEKLIDGYEITFKTLNPIIIKSWWAPWQPTVIEANNVLLQSKSKLVSTPQNVLGGLFNEPVLTSRLVPAPANKRFNGLEAQLNIEDSDYRIVAVDNVSDPNWNIIRFSVDGVDWEEFNLFDFDEKGIAKYETLAELSALLIEKFDDLGYILSIASNAAGLGLRVSFHPLYIDLTAQGWEWFGFVPTGVDNGAGVNILDNTINKTLRLASTGPIPFYTPHEIHFVKLNVRYDVFEARPR